MITVKVMHPDAGYNTDKENIKKLETNVHYQVYHIDMGAEPYQCFSCWYQGKF